MNENLNLVEILKDCPKWTKLYSPLYGDVELFSVHQNDCGDYNIEIKINERSYVNLTIDGRLFAVHNCECMLFPSKDQRDWSKFKVKSNKPKFDPKTLKPFDKVLVFIDDIWFCDLYSHHNDNTPYDDYVAFSYVCVSTNANRVIPYNDDTKHIVGTNDEAPEFYRYWED